MRTRRFIPAVLLVTALPILLAISPAESPALPAGTFQERDCVGCHTERTPNIVADWEASKHAQNGIDCATCHMGEYTSVHNRDGNSLPTPQVCAQCHPDRVEQFSAGKHALAWAAMKAMPSTHMLPVELSEGMKGCGGCHKIGLKSDEEIAELRADGHGYGVASCDACHTRHIFSAAEARQPEACQTCHMGFDHPQWEMYSSSKHGVRHGLKRDGILPESAAAPTCQTCHMQEKDHEVRTPWGFLAVRLPLSEDPQWQADQVTILQALGVLDLEGNPTGRLELVQNADLARLTQEDFDAERDKLISACRQCHSGSFARGEIAKGDEMIRQADHLLAEA
ncbi:multiheme c-type cytochrome, partial [Gemmatimonadota bacterium]